MAKTAWGMKRTCQGCGARFYDLQRDPIVCPKCATVFDPESAQRTRRSRSAVAPAKPTPPRPIVPDKFVAPEEVAAEIGEEIEAIEESVDADEVIEDTEDLPEDENEVAEVIENVNSEET
ncbi:MAG: TIGR02300 family protein [Dongiaceae bacterium]